MSLSPPNKVPCSEHQATETFAFVGECLETAESRVGHHVPARR
ncbi:predicted protein [Plenodomus lingam JN3]|uniref:Predicted protein n=1 Tax=Leptosphaeria maculans (strain JN3 / isolate v23.1.3 / race Av1-4-5-6-7-8) TaxID=985895 RepID=E4ZPD1_LEPMJ|nr:predicted protein [Plenodomus lingam JN3]CBX93156.1 predicted protein [Plenodomus lingam JN3]